MPDPIAGAAALHGISFFEPIHPFVEFDFLLIERPGHCFQLIEEPVDGLVESMNLLGNLYDLLPVLCFRCGDHVLIKRSELLFIGLDLLLDGMDTALKGFEGF